MTERVKITIDSREPKDIKYYLNRYHKKNYDFDTAQLQTGDFLTDKVIIERKTIKDLFSSINDGRFTGQMNRLATYSEHVKVLLIVGDLKKDCMELNRSIRSRKIKCNETTLVRTAASASYRYGLNIIWAHDQKEALRLMLAFISGVHDEKYGDPVNAYPNVLLARYLGIPKHSMDILINKYLTLEILLRTPESELIKIDGIGTKRARILKERLTNKITIGSGN